MRSIGLPNWTMTAKQIQNKKWEKVHTEGRHLRRTAEEEPEFGREVELEADIKIGLE